MARLLRTIRSGLLKDVRGSAAVEFAFVALPLIMLIGGIFELMFLNMVSSSLEVATTTAARTIRTNAFQATGGGVDEFKKAICGKMAWSSGDCMNRLMVDVRVLGTFQNIGPIDPDDLQFSAGLPTNKMLIRTAFKFPLFIPFLNAGAAYKGGDATLTAAATFQNEPAAQ